MGEDFIPDWCKELTMPATPLHCSLYRLCRKQIVSDHDFMKSKGFKTIPEVDAALFEEYRLFKLHRTVNYVAQRSRFYKDLFAKAGIKSDDISTMTDISRVPLTTAADIAADPYAFLCVSQGMVERAITFTSSGTVGPKKRIFFTESDIEAMTDYMGAGMKTVADSSDVVQILLPEGPVLGQSDLLARGVQKMGARPVMAGMFASPEEQIETIRKNGSTVIFGETHLIYRITKAMEHKCDLVSLGVRTLFLTTSYASPVMIEYLKRTWNVRISNHYGLTEMGLGLAVDCPLCGAYHFNELDVIGEVVDPETGQIMPMGLPGELVFTTLQREAMPFIRYRSRDLAVLGECNDACGSRLKTIGHVRSRVESHVHLQGGAVLYPTIFHETLFTFPGIIDYEMSIETLDGIEVLTIEVETHNPDEVFRQRIIDGLDKDPSGQGLNRGGVNIQVQFKDLGSLKQGAHFKKMIMDRRKHS
jgi:phenylacetate-CoA ligase